jgi:hypothetical protein
VRRPQSDADILSQFSGKWVAVKGGRVIEAEQTPDKLYAVLHAKRTQGATIFRVPDEDEPELVGLG